MIDFIYILIGILAGLLSGLLGIGGGIVIVPALIIIFKSLNLFPDTIIMPIAVATSLASIIFTSSSSALAYNKQKLIVWPIFWNFIPGLSIGIVSGIIMVHHISSDTLIKSFSIFLIMVAIYLYFKPDKLQEVASESITPTQRILLFVLAILIGILSISFGIGGGMLMVPTFLFLGLTIRQASGTSAICGVPIAILGTCSFIVTGLGYSSNPKLWGFVYWPAAAIITSVSIFFAPIGVRIGGNFHPGILRKIFSFILICTAIHLAF